MGTGAVKEWSMKDVLWRLWQGCKGCSVEDARGAGRCGGWPLGILGICRSMRSSGGASMGPTASSSTRRARTETNPSRCLLCTTGRDISNARQGIFNAF